MFVGKTYTFKVDSYDNGIRLDKYITAQFPLYSRSFLQGLIEKGTVSINEHPIQKSGTKIRENDLISITIPEQKKHTPSDIEHVNIDIIFEHPHFIIINKPPGLIVHKPHQAHEDITLVDWITYMFKDIAHVGIADRPGIVHRLDKNTSGLMIIPRTNYAHTILSNLFKQRAISKTYYAIVHGHPPREGSINLPIGRDPITHTKMRAFFPDEQKKYQQHVTMRPAISHYNVLEYFDDAALVEIKPVTGRTHQIRVHMAAIGHPLLGDTMYGGKTKYIQRQALHAYALVFNFDQQPFRFTCPPPADFEHTLSTLKKD